MKRLKLDPKLLLWAGYVAYFMFCFVAFSYLMFPYDRLQQFAKDQFASQAGGKGDAAMKLDIGSISPYWPPGLTLHDIEVKRPGKPNEPPLAVALESVTARLRVLPLLVGKRSLGFSAEQGAGSLDGAVSMTETRTDVDLDLDAIDIDALGLSGLLSLPLKGQLSGAVALLLSTVPTESDGDIELTIANLQLGDGKAKVPVPGMRDGLTIERINAGTLTMTLEVRQGVVEIKTLTTSGPDLKLEGGGTIKLSEKIGRSKVDATLELAFSDAYKNRNDRTKAIFQLIAFQPEMKGAVTDGGGLRFRVTGSLSAPRAKPQGGRPGAAKRAGGK